MGSWCNWQTHVAQTYVSTGSNPVLPTVYNKGIGWNTEAKARSVVDLTSSVVDLTSSVVIPSPVRAKGCE